MWRKTKRAYGNVEHDITGHDDPVCKIRYGLGNAACRVCDVADLLAALYGRPGAS